LAHREEGLEVSSVVQALDLSRTAAVEVRELTGARRRADCRQWIAVIGRIRAAGGKDSL
jgi:hypothetical protein